MQTFLPVPDFKKSAAILDRPRLGKQRVEAMQILKALRGESDGWRNHPAVKMWAGHQGCLMFYLKAMIDEWRSRGYRDTIWDNWKGSLHTIENLAEFHDPKWLGDPLFHAAHRSNLLRKDFSYYSQFGWNEPSDLNYVWPTT